MTVPAHTFAEADLIDIRRFAGYPAVGTGVIVFPFPWWFRYYSALETRLQNLTDAEATVVTTYLGQLRDLEAAIVGAGDNLDTLEAGPWKWNSKEVEQRTKLLDQWRQKLCGFLGVPPGPDLNNSGGGMRIVV
ncbi:hypothetical protein M5E06_17855 [Azospirillum sp. A1-3]|uniref:hypothetical protein n=1 Tax=Azospirillum sp. A1-3 TaxID=185874 RepID=UPI0020779426|nr:hypothetical protein [Azospirillum sp. A1-3]MCM8736001.1 hypothetical protein [Azospirillum sp. A1-3]